MLKKEINKWINKITEEETFGDEVKAIEIALDRVDEVFEYANISNDMFEIIDHSRHYDKLMNGIKDYIHSLWKPAYHEANGYMTWECQW